MAIRQKGAISFGLVHIPVALYTATQDSDVRFTSLCREDNSRVRYKKVCSGCGKEVNSKEIVKGFEYDKDKFVVVTDEDFEKIKTEKDRTINILKFVPLPSIAPIYFDKTYHVIPDAGGEKAFELLRAAMQSTNTVAVAKAVLGNKDTLMTVLPTDEGVLIETMFFEDEIKELPKNFKRPQASDTEMKMAVTLIEAMGGTFEPEEFKDEYQERLRDLIERKINGKQIVAPKEKRTGGGTIDLMQALKASVEGKKPAKKPAARKKEKSA